MGVDVARGLRRNQNAGKAVTAGQVLGRQPWTRLNTVLAIGLWALLWAGYNTGPEHIGSPGFPANTMELIHSLRAFIPMLAGWFALLRILTGPNLLTRWIVGPLGLLVLYAVVGLASSALVSIKPAEAMYWGGNYLAIVLVLLAIVANKDPLSDLSGLLFFNWVVAGLITVSMLGLLPFLSGGVPFENPIGAQLHGWVSPDILGMAGTRSTGFARYAAISGIVALAKIWKGMRLTRLVWVCLLAVSLYALVLSNGRTEVLAFVASVFLVMIVQKSKRTIFLLVGAGSTALLGLAGFYRGFYLYITRTGHIDPTMSGRTETWHRGWGLLLKSPWWGLGFQADRFYLREHMHDAFLHALVQSGILGGGALFIALLIVWRLTAKHFFFRPPRNIALIPAEVPGVLMFITISSITECTFAYYSAAWLLSAPLFAYVAALDRHMRRSHVKAAWERALRGRLARNSPRAPEPSGGVEVALRPLSGSGTKS
ncbi:MAG: O-antigen ligase family protein [Acidobacteriia bacterium]|nr:O-antigen ligase family protein [Terriglobia bacterium]